MRDIEEIYQEMLQVFSQRSGYLPKDACDLSVRLYALAAQVQALYAQADWVMAQSFPQTASGQYLDYHGETRGITRSAATAAKGTVRFFVSAAVTQDLFIPAKTVCMTAGGQRFATVEAAVLRAGALYVDVPAAAMETGSGGNIGAGLITVMAVPPAGITRCGNPQPFAGGAEEESDASLRERILDSYRRLPNGANAAFYEQEAMGFPSVAAATAVGRARGIGTVDVYVATVAGPPEPELIGEIQSYLQEKREIAVDLRVLSPRLRPVDLNVKLKPAQGYTHEQAAAAADTVLRGYFTGRLLGKGVLLSEMGHLLYELPSVANYAFVSPAADVPAAVGELPTLNSLVMGRYRPMGYGAYLRELLRPPGVYDLSEESCSGSELRAAGAALDGCGASIEHAEREAILATAEAEGLRLREDLFAHRPADYGVKRRREAIAALLQVSGDSFTLEGINRAIRGCGIWAQAQETGEYGHIRVIFPDVSGIPEGFEQIRDVILDLIPCHLETEFYFRYITWAECEAQGFTWEMVHAGEHTWHSFELAV